MAQKKRSEIITLAKVYAARKAQNIDLVDEFDFVTKDISEKVHILAGEDTGNLTADQNYIALPSDYVDQRLFSPDGRRVTAFKVADDWLPLLKNPVDFQYYDQTLYGNPVLYMVEDSPNILKLYFYPKTETDTPAYVLLYWKRHPKATDDNYLHLYGESWDDVVAHGVAWRAGVIIKDGKIIQSEYGLYMRELLKKSFEVNRPRYSRVRYHHF